MSSKSPAEIEAFLVQWLARELKLPEDEVWTDAPLTNLGLSSRAAVALSGDLEDFIDAEVDPSVAWDHPTIEALSQHLGSS